VTPPISVASTGHTTADTLVTVADVRVEALSLLDRVDGLAYGDALDAPTAALVELAVHASVSTLDGDGIERNARRALDAGATPAQVHETLVVVSGLGVHSLMVGSRRVAGVLRERGDTTLDGPLDDDRAALRARLQGDDPYWDDFEREVPGFLDALLRLSPEAYEAFFAYTAVPWRTGALRGRVKELTVHGQRRDPDAPLPARDADAPGERRPARRRPQGRHARTRHRRGGPPASRRASGSHANRWKWKRHGKPSSRFTGMSHDDSRPVSMSRWTVELAVLRARQVSARPAPRTVSRLPFGR
jgi:hypothetical protein